MPGTEATLERTFTQADFDHFAVLSGDDNPIHTDPAFAEHTGFGRTVAHGLLLCSVLGGLIDRLVPRGRVLEQAIVFPAPTFTDEIMQFSAVIQFCDERTSELRLEVKRKKDQLVTCYGHCQVCL